MKKKLLVGALGALFLLVPMHVDAKDLIVMGHGNQPSGIFDPGAIGNGTSEAKLLRDELLPHIRKYTGNEVDIYNPNKDMYGFGDANVVSGYGSVTEIHMDSAGPTATGGHVIYNANSTPDAQDIALKNVMNKYVGLHGTGLKPRLDLYNMNVFAYRGISYRLVELGFITNANDVNNVRKNIDPLAKDIVHAITGKPVNPTNPSKPKPGKDDYKESQHVKFNMIYDSPDGPINSYIPADQKWTQVGTITRVDKGRLNPYRIENSGKLLGYANKHNIDGLFTPGKQPTPAKTFTIGVDEGIILRNGSPSLSAPVYGIWPKGTQFRYDSVHVADGYVWLGGTDSNGTRIYIPVGPNDGNPSNTWGTGY